VAIKGIGVETLITEHGHAQFLPCAIPAVRVTHHTSYDCQSGLNYGRNRVCL